MDALNGTSRGKLLVDGTIVLTAVIATRIVWVPVFTYVPRVLSRRLRERDPYPPWQAPVILSWTGMRGAVSLAAALALPLETDAGAAFPHRDLIIFLTFAVILGTLLLQGLTLPGLVRALGIEDDGAFADEESKARLKATKAALRRIEELKEAGTVREETAERMSAMYNYRLRRFRARFDDGDGDGEEIEQRSEAYQHAVREVLDAQREELLSLRDQGIINDEVMRRVERDFDLEDQRLEI
jgi:CPA1 family monovalent cation:H+ antiporter